MALVLAANMSLPAEQQQKKIGDDRFHGNSTNGKTMTKKVSINNIAWICLNCLAI